MHRLWSAVIRIKRKFESADRLAQFQRIRSRGLSRPTDRTLGMVRTKVHCANCSSHLGYVSEDGQPPTYPSCINGIAMNFLPD
jgi:peptide-methionine (R)-S-oxide reductase